MKAKEEEELSMIEETKDYNQIVIKNKKLKKKVIELEAERQEMQKQSKMLNKKIEHFEGKIKEWKSKCKLERKCSEKLKVKLQCSVNLYAFIAPTLEKNLRKKTEVNKKGSRFN